ERPIEDVAPGDFVMSCYGSGDFRPARVLRTHRADASRGVAITTRSGRRIVSTEDHVHFAGFVGLGAYAAQRHELEVVLCDRRGATPMHRISLFGYDDEGREALESIGLSVRPARRGS